MVAVLQYRWTKELSVATKLALGALYSHDAGWHLDFYSEFVRGLRRVAGWSRFGCA